MSHPFASLIATQQQKAVLTKLNQVAVGSNHSIRHSKSSLSRYAEEAWLVNSPLLWLDTKGKGWEEDVEDEESISNIGEAVMVANVVGVLTNLGLSQRDIGVISPYWAQVALIR